MDHSEESKKTKKKVTISLAIGLKSLLITLISIAVIGLTFYLGWHFGYRSQIHRDSSSNLPFINNNQSLVKHRALVGTVGKISSSQITVDMANKQTQTASISSSTIIRNTKGQTIAATSLQSGSRVIVTATQGSNNSLAAENILVLD